MKQNKPLEYYATFTRLEDNSWGIRILVNVNSPFSPEPMSQIVVSKKDGTSQVEVVGRVLSSNKNLFICTLAKLDKLATPEQLVTRKFSLSKIKQSIPKSVIEELGYKNEELVGHTFALDLQTISSKPTLFTDEIKTSRRKKIVRRSIALSGKKHKVKTNLPEVISSEHECFEPNPSGVLSIPEHGIFKILEKITFRTNKTVYYQFRVLYEGATSWLPPISRWHIPTYFIPLGTEEKIKAWEAAQEEPELPEITDFPELKAAQSN